ncbi:MAG: alanine--tRNA ligase [Nevskiales bacterium]
MLTSNELRSRFLDYFKQRGHIVVPSSPLVPGNDPTLLFTNAGMVQFKDTFLGRDPRPYARAASSQRCVRAGGKHNDLENVGYTARHHTFFEMLGNFSFGDYFKREAIQYGWEFLTKELHLAPNKLWVTVYEKDEDAAHIWLKDIGVDPARFSRIGAKDNFWSMGDTGPCGPCSEIFYDHGHRIPGGPPGSREADSDRYIEIWNLVFMQYDRAADGKLTPLPKPSVDTGMGLERIAAVTQGVHSNYEIDLFRNLIKAAAEATGVRDARHNSLKVIADHIRAAGFLITDGVLPGNEGRGYVLRRIMRRAIRHGYKLGQPKPFFHALVGVLSQEMGAAYPELKNAQAHVEKVIRQEEERFADTLGQGMKLLELEIADLADKMIPGETVFRLYDTFGFPVDLTADIARERGLSIDVAGFEQAMEGQRNRARAASQFDADYARELEIEGKSEFTGYEHEVDEGQVAALIHDGKQVKELRAGKEASVILDRTPFYAESGGQIGDTGRLVGGEAVFIVRDTQKSGEAIAHIGALESGVLQVGDKVHAEIDAARRAHIKRNHSATHLLHAALRKLLGTHVTQKGSLVAPDRLRFDFSHYAPMKPAEIVEVERLVNAEILKNQAADQRLSSYDEAIAGGAMALFGEKYGATVRVMRFGDFSTELCGGTHVNRVGDIGLFKITGESGVASGVRRLEAVSGEGALQYVAETEQRLRAVGELVKGGREDVADKVAQLLEKTRKLEKQLELSKSKAAARAGGDLAAQAETIGQTKLLAARLDGQDIKSLRETLDQLKNKLGSAVIVLGAVNEGKVSLIAGVTHDRIGQVKAGELVGFVAGQVGGKGGGRADMAQAGGTQPENLDTALASVKAWVGERLGTRAS